MYTLILYLILLDFGSNTLVELLERLGSSLINLIKGFHNELINTIRLNTKSLSSLISGSLSSLLSLSLINAISNLIASSSTNSITDNSARSGTSGNTTSNRTLILGNNLQNCITSINDSILSLAGIFTLIMSLLLKLLTNISKTSSSSNDSSIIRDSRTLVSKYSIYITSLMLNIIKDIL